MITGGTGKAARATPDTVKGRDEANQDINISLNIRGIQILYFNNTHACILFIVVSRHKSTNEQH